MPLDGFVVTPETRLAAGAVERLAAAVRAGRAAISPLVLHGPPGTGKTLLVDCLTRVVTLGSPPRTVRTVAAADLAADGPPDAGRRSSPALDGARTCDLVIVEDVQHLPARSAGALARLIDHRTPRRRPVVVTASTGPALLTALPSRLTSRLSAGLVVGLEPLSAESRRRVLHHLAERTGVKAGPGVLDWIADATPGGARPLQGALSVLAELARRSPEPPTLAAAQAHWAEHEVAQRPTLERVARRVAAYFRVDLKSVRGRGRQPRTLAPCQVAMFLARELTGSTWPRIGGYFGGRDASTVRHAYSVVSGRQEADAALSTALRQLRAELVVTGSGNGR